MTYLDAFVGSDRVRLEQLRRAHDEVGADRAGTAGEEPPAVSAPTPQHAIPAHTPAEEGHRCKTRRTLPRKGTAWLLSFVRFCFNIFWVFASPHLIACRRIPV